MQTEPIITPTAIRHTFAEQGRIYIDQLSRRNRKRAKPATLAAYESYLRTHIIPGIGDLELSTFGNAALKLFVQTLIEKKLSPKSIQEIAAFARGIVLSAVDHEGEPLYARTWRLDFVDAPPVLNQRQPTITKDKLQDALRVRHAYTDKYRIIVGLLAATGVRVGELVALRCGDDGEHSGWNQTDSSLIIRTSLWRGEEQKPKTLSSIRKVDLSEPVNAMLAEYVKRTNKKPGDYLFATRNGTPLSPSSLRKYVLVPLGIPGFHSLRRWRVSYLKSIGIPDSLLKSWIGHSSNGSDITARYDKSADDKQWRHEWANKVGIGFDLPPFESGHPAPSSTKKPNPVNLPRFLRTTTQPNVAEPVEQTFQATDDDLDPLFFAPPAQEQA
jgi:integrase